MKLCAEYSMVTTLSLESQIDKLSLEANLLDNLLDTFRNIIPNLTTKLTEIAVMFNSKNDPKEIASLKVLQRSLTAKTPHVSFGSYSKMLISIPEGFKGNLAEYLNMLNKINETVYIDGIKILDEYNVILASFINNKEAKISLKDHTHFFKDISVKREKIVKDISSYFTTNTNSKAYLSSVMERFAEMENIINETIKLSQIYSNQNVSRIKSSLDNSIDLLKIIIDDSNKDNIDAVSGNAAKNISIGAYEVAKYVELISIYRFRLEQSIITVIKLLEELDKILR